MAKKDLKTIEIPNEKSPEAKQVVPAKVDAYWKSTQSYMKNMGFLSKWIQNDNFLAGNQWAEIPKNKPHLLQMPRPVLNFLAQIVDFKTASVKSESVRSIFSTFGTSGANLGEGVVDLGDLLTKMTEVTWERCRLDSINTMVVDRAAATGLGIVHLYWDNKIKGKIGGKPFIGDIKAQCIDAMYVGFGNPQELDVQEQPFIIIQQRMNVKAVKQLVKKNGATKEVIDAIESDNLDASSRYDGSSQEVDEAKKINVYTLYYKDNDTVWFTKTTSTTVITEPTDTGLKLYPVAIMPWKVRMDCIYGSDEVNWMIPNQRLVNGLLSMDAMSKQLTGFPKMIVDKRYVDTRMITNTVGEIIPIGKANLPPNYNPISYLQPAAQTQNVSQLVDMIIQKTKDIAGANEAITGEANTNNASAIMLLQKSSGLPNEDIRRRYYQYIEDLNRVIVDFYRAYYTLERTVYYAKQGGGYGEAEFSPGMLDDLEFMVRSDIGASSIFGDSNAVATLDKMVQLGFINKAQYAKYMPKGSMPFKEEILSDFKTEATLQKQIQEAEGTDSAGRPIAPEPEQPSSIESEMANAVPPETEPQRTRLQEEYGKSAE